MAARRHANRDQILFIPFVNERDGCGRLIESQKVPTLPFKRESVKDEVLDVSTAPETGRPTRRRKQYYSVNRSNRPGFEPLNQDSDTSNIKLIDKEQMASSIHKSMVMSQVKGKNTENSVRSNIYNMLNLESTVPFEDATELSVPLEAHEIRGVAWRKWKVKGFGQDSPIINEPSSRSMVSMPKMHNRHVMLCKDRNSESSNKFNRSAVSNTGGMFINKCRQIPP
jgi:hypothetical protein